MPRVPKILACPECQGQAAIDEISESEFCVYCSECGFEETEIIHTGDWMTDHCAAVTYPSRYDAVMAWNAIER